MAGIVDYTSLVSAIQQVTEDDGPEFVAYIPTAIDLAEERLIKELDFPELATEVSGAVTTAFISKPANYRIPLSMKLYVNGNTEIEFSSAFSSDFSRASYKSGCINLKKRMSDYMEDYWPDSSQIGTPKYYGDFSTTNFVIVPTPSASFTYKLRYVGSPTKLSASNLSNYFTDHCKDALYAASMLEMAIFMKAWSQVSVWQQRFDMAKANWEAQAQRQRRDNGETPMASQGPNTVKHTVQESNA